MTQPATPPPATSPTVTLPEMLAASVERAGDAPAFRDGPTSVTYAELGERCAAVARALVARGVRPGDRVAFALPNVVEFADWYYGSLMAGAVAVPLNPVLRVEEVAAQLRHAGASVLATWPGLDGPAAGAAEAGIDALVVTPGTGPIGYLPETDPATPMPRRESSDIAVLLFTSGTTSSPKAAMLTHENLVANATVAAASVGIRGDDVLLGSLPLFHAFGQTVCLNLAVSLGAHTVMQPQFNPRAALGLIESAGVTVVVAVPSMFTAMTLQHRRAGEADLSRVRFGISGGSPLAPETHARVTAALGFLVREGYGLSECSPVVTLNQGEENRPGSVGTALPGLTLGLVDPETGEPAPGEVGELTVAGHCVMRGYWQDPAATAAVLSPDGVLRTGDMARIGADGYVEIVDRRKDLVIVAGENVYPREVEDVIKTHPDVADCAVLGMPDDVRGEIVVAAVIRTEGSSLTDGDVRDHVHAHLAGFKVPRHVWFPAELPLGSTGKILKRAIEIPEDVRRRR